MWKCQTAVIKQSLLQHPCKSFWQQVASQSIPVFPLCFLLRPLRAACSRCFLVFSKLVTALPAQMANNFSWILRFHILNRNRPCHVRLTGFDWSLFCCHCRNLPHRVTEADSGQICTWRVSRQQRGGHQCSPDHWRAEGQQTSVLPEPVTLLVWHLSSTFPRSPPSSHHSCTFSFIPSALLTANSLLPLSFISFSAFHCVFYRTFELTRALLICHEKKSSWSLHVTCQSGALIFFFFFVQRVNVKKGSGCCCNGACETEGCEVNWYGYH